MHIRVLCADWSICYTRVQLQTRWSSSTHTLSPPVLFLCALSRNLFPTAFVFFTCLRNRSRRFPRISLWIVCHARWCVKMIYRYSLQLGQFSDQLVHVSIAYQDYWWNVAVIVLMHLAFLALVVVKTLNWIHQWWLFRASSLDRGAHAILGSKTSWVV